MTENNTDFITYPKTFENYKWYKPILVLIVSIVAYVILIFLLTLVFGFISLGSYMISPMPLSHEVMADPSREIFTDLCLFMMVPALYFGSMIVKDRPFSSYLSTRGKWNYKLYLKAFIIPFIIVLLSALLPFNSQGGVSNFSLLLLIATIIFIPLQCIAEEVIYRGFVMQTFGAWFKIPLAAIILQSVVFTIGHGYNIAGISEVFVSGIIYGIFTWKTNGIEVSSAMHTANNLAVSLFFMFGINGATSSLATDIIVAVGLDIVIAAIMYYVGKKTEWFGEIQETS